MRSARCDHPHGRNQNKACHYEIMRADRKTNTSRRRRLAWRNLSAPGLKSAQIEGRTSRGTTMSVVKKRCAHCVGCQYQNLASSFEEYQRWEEMRNNALLEILQLCH